MFMKIYIIYFEIIDENFYFEILLIFGYNLEIV